MKEIMNLILQLNDKLKERVPPAKKTQGVEAGNTEVVIIIMTSREEKKTAPVKAAPPKNSTSGSDWIRGLCREIEKGACSRK